PTLLPSMVNVAVPVGVPAADVTVAVNVTDWPTPDGLRLDVRLVVVRAATVWVTVPDVLAANPVAPPYWATTACDPAASELVLNVATPLAFKPMVPTVLPSMVKVAVPVGVPDPDVTVAVKVTDWPTVDGFWLDVSAVVVVAATVWVTVFEVD